MQTIRIYANGKLVHSVTGIAHKEETEELRREWPEPHFLWLR